MCCIMSDGSDKGDDDDDDDDDEVYVVQLFMHHRYRPNFERCILNSEK